jgi:vacuolar protein sorting-associated protein VTA1
VNKGLELLKKAGGDNKEVKSYILSELTDLEKMKAAVDGTSKEDNKYAVENFILSVFAKLDKEERTCEQVTKEMAINFKKCGDFIALLHLFGEVEPEWAEKEKYCKYKAATILKALKTGE